MCVRACVCVRAYQFGQAPLAEDPARAGQVVVSADPAPHVEPLSGAPWGGAVLPVEQNQLLLGPHGAALQHALQLARRNSETPPEKTMREGRCLRPHPSRGCFEEKKTYKKKHKEMDFNCTTRC